jgi:hypothetical protein
MLGDRRRQSPGDPNDPKSSFRLPSPNQSPRPRVIANLGIATLRDERKRANLTMQSPVKKSTKRRLFVAVVAISSRPLAFSGRKITTIL